MYLPEKKKQKKQIEDILERQVSRGGGKQREGLGALPRQDDEQQRLSKRLFGIQRIFLGDVQRGLGRVSEFLVTDRTDRRFPSSMI